MDFQVRLLVKECMCGMAGANTVARTSAVLGADEALTHREINTGT